MLKEAAVKITKFVVDAEEPVVENGESVWIYGILFKNDDPSFPAVVLIHNTDEEAGNNMIRTVAISPASSYEFEVPYFATNGIHLELFSGGTVTAHIFHSNGGA